jgi:hypothetical protein
MLINTLINLAVKSIKVMLPLCLISTAKKMTPLLSVRRGRGGGWYRRQMTASPNPSLSRRGIIFIAGGDPKDHAASALSKITSIPRKRESIVFLTNNGPPPSRG